MKKFAITAAVAGAFALAACNTPESQEAEDTNGEVAEAGADAMAEGGDAMAGSMEADAMAEGGDAMAEGTMTEGAMAEGDAMTEKAK